MNIGKRKHLATQCEKDRRRFIFIALQKTHGVRETEGPRVTIH